MERRLGRGISALLPGAKKDEITLCEISKIKTSKFQARKKFDRKALEELAESIREVGIVEPLVVRKLPDGKFELVCGERRLRAAQMAGLTKVPVVVKQLTDRQAYELSLIENIQREDLSPIEYAIAFEKLITEYGYTHEQIARRIGKSRSWVTNILRLFSLPPEVRQLVDEGKISVGHAKALLKLKDNPQKLVQVAKQIVEENLSVRDVEQIVRSEERKEEDSTAKSVEGELSRKFGKAKVTVRKKNGSASITIRIPSDKVEEFFQTLKNALSD